MQSPQAAPYGFTPDRKSNASVQTNSFEHSPHPEPLLSLITSHHPILSTAINGSLSAYSSSKSYSPSFRYGAEFVERHIGSPVASTVGTAGRMTGADRGVRWLLQRSGSNEDVSNRSKKRRRLKEQPNRETDVEQGLPAYSSSHVKRRPSESSLDDSPPPYDEKRSPRYEEEDPDPPSPRRQNWPIRVVLSTSGLGVAMRDESLRSLRYCLNILQLGNSHLGRTLCTLKDLVKDHQQSEKQVSSDATAESNTGDQPRNQEAIDKHIERYRVDVLETIQKVVNVVSKYAGAALPENARDLVRRHLVSLPQRFHMASLMQARQVPKPRRALQSEQNSTEADEGKSDRASATHPVSSAQRVIVLATEGLDMMEQVSNVLGETLQAAELWCARLGKSTKGGQSTNEEFSPGKSTVQYVSNGTHGFGGRAEFPSDSLEPSLRKMHFEPAADVYTDGEISDRAEYREGKDDLET